MAMSKQDLLRVYHIKVNLVAPAGVRCSADEVSASMVDGMLALGTSGGLLGATHTGDKARSPTQVVIGSHDEVVMISREELEQALTGGDGAAEPQHECQAEQTRFEEVHDRIGAAIGDLFVIRRRLSRVYEDLHTEDLHEFTKAREKINKLFTSIVPLMLDLERLRFPEPKRRTVK
jgi:hypothetical protein